MYITRKSIRAIITTILYIIITNNYIYSIDDYFLFLFIYVILPITFVLVQLIDIILTIFIIRRIKQQGKIILRKNDLDEIQEMLDNLLKEKDNTK